MKNFNFNDKISVIETKFEIIGLKLKASRIRNSKHVQESLDSLAQFVGGKKQINCYSM